ncbi:MAG: cytidine deaminase [Acidobacteriota bacterium]|jgi:cytidine deaminase|nr:cytidine deaminase [Acidobacteriaceae bacterium]
MTELARQAMAARQKAFAPYSGFLVGAAVETTDGAIYTGCNIENASYGLTVCAERVAIWKAISEGVPPGAFRAIAIAADSPHPTPPCGACRQILAEFAPQATVTLINLQGVTREFTVAELLPESFNASYLR